uniref:AlNc14C441G11668 protein n=1 Tax=Albugo laibachii Nc14 TaxID=890382 RepID=F0WZS7_9STRA|nr:AlNc14C441G11668 [Albugo laibachii Nc14]|eukprot:CCA27004.1 AlNc14C441G11668 [Albugo laibachii Nc14]
MSLSLPTSIFGTDFGTGLNTLIAGLIAVHVAVLIFWLTRALQENKRSIKKSSMSKKRQ